VLSVAVLATFSMLSLERLITLSQPILLWDDALKLVAGRIDVNGVDRIHYNLGVNYLKNSMVGEAQTNIKKAIAINPDFAPAHAALGSIYNMRSQWREAVMEYTLAQNIDERKALPPNWRYFLGRARAYESAGEPRAALQDYAEACRLDLSVCDTLRKSAVQK
jgi:Tfp pilus assembly protein PilF